MLIAGHGNGQTQKKIKKKLKIQRSQFQRLLMNLKNQKKNWVLRRYQQELWSLLAKSSLRRNRQFYSAVFYTNSTRTVKLRSTMAI